MNSNKRSLWVLVKRFIRRKFVKPHDKISFLYELKPRVEILDVGCGNNSPYLVKTILPDSIYTGVDIGDYNQTKPNLADHYIVSSPENFAGEIGQFKECFDAVISTHNIEHCYERVKTIDAMLDAVRPGGWLFMTFPSEQSVNFPRREGTLNYYDDPTHRDLPPDFESVIKQIKAKNFALEVTIKSHKPLIFWLIGFLNEWNSRTKNRTYYSTWAYYGFESVIKARKLNTADTVLKS